MWTGDPGILKVVSVQCDKSYGSVTVVSKLGICDPGILNVVSKQGNKRCGSIMIVTKLWICDTGVVNVLQTGRTVVMVAYCLYQKCG